MISFKSAMVSGIKEPVTLLDPTISVKKYTRIDLSVDNMELAKIDISNPVACQRYIDTVLARAEAMIAYGGYLEKRNLYKRYTEFSNGGAPHRNIHLGLDLWTRAGTRVCAPLNGKIHSFKNNENIGDYGPTIILKHELNGIHFYTLYGHLSLESLQNLHVGNSVSRGQYFATLGSTEINVNYAPHLHFQLIQDIGDHRGDYPGVCEEAKLAYYSSNCPNPNLLLRL